jgi:hypothetical protein
MCMYHTETLELFISYIIAYAGTHTDKFCLTTKMSFPLTLSSQSQVLCHLSDFKLLCFNIFSRLTNSVFLHNLS